MKSSTARPPGNALLRNRCFLLALLLAAAIVAEFWLASRYPALLDKAATADSVSLPQFQQVFVIGADDSFVVSVLKGTVNWGASNWRGMSFGLMFGASLMTILSLLRRKAFKGSFANSVLGVIIGMPLGVCVNCAAPILRGLHASGLRLETALAAMISSPTMNVIVLAMLFALFPLHVAVIKLVATLLLLLLVIPLLSKYVFADGSALSVQRAIAAADKREVSAAEPALITPTAEEESRWLPALAWLFRAWLANLWFVARVAVPLMVVAGLLGVTLLTLFPLDALAGLLPEQPFFLVLLAMCLLAVLGVFIPVPITFDIVLVAALASAGLPPIYVGVLLFTLGAYSVYSYLIVARAMSRSTGLTLWLAVSMLGVLAGLATDVSAHWFTAVAGG